jgi:hypothetical protein
VVLGSRFEQHGLGRPRRTVEASPATDRRAVVTTLLSGIWTASRASAGEQQQFPLLREAVGSQHEAKIDRQNHKQRLSGVQSNVK